MQTAEHGRQQSGDSGASGMDGDVTTVESTQIIDCGLGHVELGENALGMARQKSPGFRQADAVGAPVDQLGPKVILEMIDLTTDGSRGASLPLCGLTDRTRLDERNE